MNGARLTTLVVQQVEELIDCYDAAMADRCITAEEDVDIREQKAALYALSMDADEAVALTVTMLRRGPDSVSLKRRMVERGIRLQREEEGRAKIIAFRGRTDGPGVA